MLRHSYFQSCKWLLYKKFFVVLSCKSEDVYDYTPSWFDVDCLCTTDIGYAHYDVLFDVCTSMKVV